VVILVDDGLATAPAPETRAGQHTIAGLGGEPYQSGRGEGCTFSCDGVREREADVVKLCKTVRIAVKPAAK
jgi:hypothetical protein